MAYLTNRRGFLRTTAATSGLIGAGGLGFLARLPGVSAAEASLNPETVQFGPEIEPLVRLLEQTPRDRLLEEVGSRLQKGLGYQPLLAALMLAGVRNIQPRPVGFKFHAVLVVHSAHLASLASSGRDRWLPMFWALDYFKDSQAQDARQGDWVLEKVEASKLPPSHKARQAFMEAMANWDADAADAAVVSLVRHHSAHEVFETFCHFGARDFRDIGHKAIYLANGWRTLQTIGWQHAEPIMRSLAYALLQHEGGNPAERDARADRPWRENQKRVDEIRTDWIDGILCPESTRELLATLREASPEEVSQRVVALLNGNVSPQSIWDALFEAAGELLMRRPGILSLHAVTTANAIHYAYEQVGDDRLRRLFLLQNAAFLPLFRRDPASLPGKHLTHLTPLEPEAAGDEAVDEIFADVSGDRDKAARKVLAYANAHPEPSDFLQTARQLIFTKGTNAHDYKFSSAVLEDYLQLSPKWRPYYLASSVYNLRGSEDPDNGLVTRTREAIEGV